MAPETSKPKLLLLGAEGQLGHEVARLAAEQGTALSAVGRRAVDITRPHQLREAVGAGFAAVINAAAYTAVDRAESEAELAYAINRDGAAHLAEACQETGSRLIHISTDYVFDGLKGAPYDEGDPVDPLNVYGRSKEAGEAAVRSACTDHVILRTSWVFGVAGGNFVKTMLRLGRERETLSVVADQYGCPTPAAALAARVLAAAGQTACGTFHCAGAARTSWFDFAGAIFAEQQALTGRAGPALHPIATADYPTAAARPMDSTLDSGLFQATFGTAPVDWRAGLTEMLQAVLSPQAEEGER